MKKSSILFITLWTLIFLGVLCAHSSRMARQHILFAKSIELRNVLYDTASSAIILFKDVFSNKELSDAYPKIDSLNDLWANHPFLFDKIKIGQAQASFRYQYVDNISGEKEYRYGFIDEDRKLNLNNINYSDLILLLKNVAKMQEPAALKLAANIIDWRDRDDIIYNDNYGNSEIQAYSQAGYNYLPKNNLYESLEEIILVKGMNPEIFFRIRDYITVYGSGRLNINTVSRAVLQVKVIDFNLVEKILAYRAGGDMKEGTFDDRLFSNIGMMVNDISKEYDLTEKEKNILNDLISSNCFSVSSAAFSLYSTSYLANQKRRGRIRCVLDKKGRIYHWSAIY
ncbi:MAG: type II secretion system protein GspK [Candidatus Omnitrophica bacterium]|nr:type II secretion system protein GspK [Candidatus Omnitrophota bacterium]